ncbi:Na/Pi symporter [Oceanobacillus limi]|uniref:Na/Pi symporter n=1 Tax=Oceanobacillus limi TaxID=930131 RepID=UPI00244E61D6|nr:Na/Pi symporter [Oceanobacillus limi]
MAGLILGTLIFRSGLFHLSTNTLKKWISNLTDTTWKCIALGILITIILQNISYVIILMMGLITAKRISFRQSIGMIIGANIGTALIIEFITIDLAIFVFPLAVIGAVLCLMKYKNFIHIGYALIGFSLIFGSMWGLRTTALHINTFPYVEHLFLILEQNLLFSSFFGIVITSFLQSFTAVSGLTLSFLFVDSMQLSTGIAILLGGGIGSVIPVLFARKGFSKEARVTAYAFAWISILHYAIYFPLINLLTTLGSALSSQPHLQLTHIHLVATIIVSLFLLFFINPFTNLVYSFHFRKVKK